MAKKKQSMAESAMILALSIAIVKLVGMIYKFPLTNRLRGGGWGYYTTAYNIYSAIYAVAVTGFPSAVSRMVAAAYAQGRYKDCVKIKKESVKLFALIGTIGCVGLMATSRWLSVSVMENPNAFLSVLAVAPSLIFSCMMAAYRGYYQGLSNMVPTAISEVVEVLFKAVFGYGAVVVLQRVLSYEYDTYGTVLGAAQTPSTEASSILAVCAAGAIFAVSVSTMAGWLSMRIIYKKIGADISDELLDSAPDPVDSKEIVVQVLRFGLPIALSAVALRVTNLIDNATVIRCLNDVIETNIGDLYASHHGLFEMISVEVEDLANYLYEVYSYGMPFFDLVPTVTAVFGTSALPHITAAVSKNDFALAKKNIDATLSITMLIAAPAGFGICFMALPILRLVYPGLTVGAQMSAPMLSVLGIAAIFSCFTSACNSMLQAVGKINVPLYTMLAGSVVKILSNYILVSIPAYNIKATPYGNLFCFMVTAVTGIILLIYYTGVKIDFLRIVVKPLLGGLATGVVARVLYNALAPVLGTRISAVFGIFVAVVFYAAVVLLFSFMNKEEMLSIPGLRKLVPTLERFHLVRE